MISLLTVPSDSAHRDIRMGAGPSAILRAGLTTQLEKVGHDTTVRALDPPGNFHAEIETAFDLHSVVRSAAEAAIADGRLPIAITGNCNTGVIGCLAAHNSDEVGLFWFDAHSDAETPETSTSGFFDGMGLAVALGECWKPKLRSLGWWGLGWGHCALVAAREVSTGARSTLHRKGVTLISPEAARFEAPSEALRDAISQFRRSGVKRVHVHLDLDVLDPDLVDCANGFALPGGLSVEQLLNLIKSVMGEFPLASASIASYDPACDKDGAVGAAAVGAITLLASTPHVGAG